MDQPLEPINVSALNQYTYCPRRFALIYLDGEFQNNIHTERGNAEHARVDRAAHVTTKQGARVEYALPIWHDELALIGKCDVVEFWDDGALYPVEYKHGKRRQHDNDDLQLTAQAMCLEVMFNRPVPSGAIFHAGSKRRRLVEFTPALKGRVVAALVDIRNILAAQLRPPPVNDRRCPECSMRDLCMPGLAASIDLAANLAAGLFEADGAPGD